MLNKVKKINTKGFTIIEVMIVLAIAALILLIVFLAIPALQRNARNTSRKSDVAALLAAVNEFTNNNNAQLPNSCSGTNPVTITQTGGSPTSSEAKVGYFNKSCVTSGATAGQIQLDGAYASTGGFNTAAQDYVEIVPAAGCAAGGKTTSGSAKQFAAVYEIENGTNSYAPVCTAS